MKGREGKYRKLNWAHSIQDKPMLETANKEVRKRVSDAHNKLLVPDYID
jgi:hypothetical protein